jgi:hypothetical protein
MPNNRGFFISLAFVQSCVTGCFLGCTLSCVAGCSTEASEFYVTDARGGSRKAGETAKLATESASSLNSKTAELKLQVERLEAAVIKQEQCARECERRY